MLEESDIMTSVLLTLMSLNIIALPIHDSVIVPAKHEETTRKVMAECYKKATGFTINIK
jgi:hypothetical protein